MPILNLEKKWCFNDVAVPLKAHMCDLEDVTKITETGDEEMQSFNLLDIRAGADIRWFSKPLEIDRLFWRKNHRKLPLIKEIKEAIAQGKSLKGGLARMPRRPDVVVPINVRGRVVLVMNSSHSLALAPKTDDEEDHITWFLVEIQKDIQQCKNKDGSSSSNQSDEPPEDLVDLHSSQESSGQKRTKRAKICTERESAVIKEALTELQGHSHCSVECFLKSRHSFKVTRKSDKTAKQYRIRSLNLKRKEAHRRSDDLTLESVLGAIREARDAAIGFLDGDVVEKS